MGRPSTSSSYHSSQQLSAKESVWALYCRSMLLWNFCTRLRKDTCPESEKAEFALEAWVETQAIQDSLDMHVCNLNTALMYMAREYIYKCVCIQRRYDVKVNGFFLLPNLQYTDDHHTSSTQVRTRFGEVGVRNLLHVSPSLQGLDSGTSPLPVFNRKQAEEWRKHLSKVLSAPISRTCCFKCIIKTRSSSG
jgi:hypothetical protein